MIYYTGDIHGNPTKILNFITKHALSSDDAVVILGDAGMNNYCDWRDAHLKHWLNKTGVTIFSIHGNHEERPYNRPGYREMIWHEGTVYVEDMFPNLLFAKDGEVYDLDGLRAIVIGGAYSVDKYYRLDRGYNWFPSEQPDETIKKRVQDKLSSLNWSVDLVLSHTCPQKYVPVEAFLPMIDQSTVDRSTEEWLDSIEDKLSYRHWLCGHWHIDKAVDRFRFVMDDFVSLP